MSWCDKLASTPAIGLRVDWQYATGDTLLNAMSPIINRQLEGDKQRFVVERLDSNGTSFTIDEGFNYLAEPGRIAVTFQHRLKARAVGGGYPTVEMVSKPERYTKLLPQVGERLLEAAVLVFGRSNRQMTRIGVIASTVATQDQLPPGISLMIDYISRPWAATISNYSLQLITDLPSPKGFKDRCIHTIVKSEDQDEDLVNVTFDWQRSLLSGRDFNENNLMFLLRETQQASLAYFEKIAEGSMFDEEIIRGEGR